MTTTTHVPTLPKIDGIALNFTISDTQKKNISFKKLYQDDRKKNQFHMLSTGDW